MFVQTIKCLVCGAWYHFNSHTVADQSLCPKCIQARDEAMNDDNKEKESEREEFRRRFFRKKPIWSSI